MSLLTESMASLHARQVEGISVYQPGSGRQKTLFKRAFLLICIAVSGYIYSLNQDIAEVELASSASLPIDTDDAQHEPVASMMILSDSTVLAPIRDVVEVPQPVNELPEKTVASAIDSAKDHMAKLRLMSPVGGNAYQELKWVLSHDSNNLDAQSLLKEIQEQYLQLIHSAHNNDNKRLYTDRLHSLEQEFTFLPRLSENLALNSAPAQMEAIEISQSFSQKEKALLIKVGPLLMAQEYDLSRQYLQDFILSEGRSTQALEVALTDSLFGLQDEAGMSDHLQKSRYVKHYISAKLESMKGRSPLAYLKSQNVHNLDRASLSYFAGLLQKAELFSEALPIYQMLAVQGGEWRDWLGLAICFERTGEVEKANRAYRKTLSLSGFSREIQQYLDARIDATNGYSSSLAGAGEW
jgi:hypothetical protein